MLFQKMEEHDLRIVVMKILHITDIHLVTSGQKLCGLDPEKRFMACIKDINAHHSDADFCVITGDLADKGEITAYRLLKRCLAELTVPYHLVIGNHDVRTNYLEVFQDAESDSYGFIQSSMKTKGGLFLFLDTKQDGTHEGAYCDLRRSWLDDQLNSAGDTPVYLFMHHPPFQTGLPSMDRIGLRDREQLFDLVRMYNNIQHIFCGHLHRPISGSWAKIPVTTLRGTNHQVALDFESFDHLYGNFEPPTYGVALLENNSVVVHFHDYQDNSELFDMGDPIAFEEFCTVDE